jgi:hypothetical protein
MFTGTRLATTSRTWNLSVNFGRRRSELDGYGGNRANRERVNDDRE